MGLLTNISGIIVETESAIYSDSFTYYDKQREHW